MGRYVSSVYIGYYYIHSISLKFDFQFDIQMVSEISHYIDHVTVRDLPGKILFLMPDIILIFLLG